MITFSTPFGVGRARNSFRNFLTAVQHESNLQTGANFTASVSEVAGESRDFTLLF